MYSSAVVVVVVDVNVDGFVSRETYLDWNIIKTKFFCHVYFN